jgi:hypothetical protein
MKIQRAIGTLIGLVFLYSSASKLFGIPAARTAPTIFADWSRHATIGYSIICGEAFMGLWMLSGIRTATAGLVAVVCLSSFSAILFIELRQSHPKPCGCTGPVTTWQSPQVIRSGLYFDLLRNGGLMIAAACMYLMPKGRNRRPVLSAGLRPGNPSLGGNSP